MTREFGARIFDHLFKLPFRYFRRWTVGEMIARVSETDTIRNFLVGTTTGVLLDLIFVVIYIAVLFTLSAPLTLIILLALPIQFLIYFGFGPFLRRRLRAQFDAGARHQTQMVENISGIDAREESSRQSEEVTRASIARLDSAIEIQADRLRTAEHLLEREATSRTAFLDVQQAYTDLEKERDVSLRELDRKMAERIALDAERRRLVTNLRSDHLTRAAEIEARLATLTEEARALGRRVDAATLTAPVSGIVDQLSVFTIGGVAQAGEELLRIVPSEAEVEFEGQFTNQDIGFMEIGQRANLRLDAYPSERFGSLKGAVSDIAADSTEISEGQWGYVVRLTPDTNYLQAGDDTFSLRPGMTATVDVTTDERRLITYFFAPIVRTLQDAMGER